MFVWIDGLHLSFGTKFQTFGCFEGIACVKYTIIKLPFPIFISIPDIYNDMHHILSIIVMYLKIE